MSDAKPQPIVLALETPFPPERLPQDAISSRYARALTEAEYRARASLEKALAAGDMKEFTPEWSMDVSSNKMPTIPYRRTPEDLIANTGIHWGQLKLYLSEVEFLSWCIRRFGRDCLRDTLVVYAGAADGSHDPMLFELFPDLRMELWDPAEFSTQVKEFARRNPGKLKYFNDYFTPEVAQSYVERGEQVFFISDIRRVPASKSNDDGTANERFKDLKDEDHYMQAEWVQAIKPRASMLKYAPLYPLPGENPIRDYFPGHIRTQALPPRTSTETRLIFEGVPDFVPYDCRRFEEIAAYHNNIVRPCVLSPGQFFTFSLNLVNGQRKTVRYTQQLPPNKIRDAFPDAPRGVWQCWGGQPRYDDWRSLGILRDWVLTIAGHAGDPAAVVNGPFDHFLPVADEVLQTCTLKAFLLLSKAQNDLRSNCLRQFITRSAKRTGGKAEASNRVVVSGFHHKTTERQIRTLLRLALTDRIEWGNSNGASCTVRIGDPDQMPVLQKLALAQGWKVNDAEPSEEIEIVESSTDPLADIVASVEQTAQPLPIKIVAEKLQSRGISYQRVCDEELGGGTKMRALGPMFRALPADIKKVTYGSPAVGGAQVAIAASAKTAGRPLAATIFTNGKSLNTEAAARLGAEVNDMGNVPQKVLNNAAERAADAGVLPLPFGLGTDSFVELLANEIKRALSSALLTPNPMRVWVVVGSGTVAKALARVFPKASFCLVQVGKWLSEDDRREIESMCSGVELFIAPETFTQVAEIQPPYRSNQYYDAKLWRFFLANGQDGDLIWNVA